MSKPIRVLVHGASGRMGLALMRLAPDVAQLQVVAAVARTPERLPIVAGVQRLAAGALPDAPAFDVAIDFSLPDGFERILALCVERGAALVSGTTGLDAGQRQAMERAARQVPVLWASNFSLGVAVLNDLVERAAAALQGWDCDIVESHHVHKQDAPSGTALTLGEHARMGGAAPRYASLRAGDIVGEHLVQFTTLGERIELVHRATNRDIFARGALHCAARLVGRPAGVYGVRDLLDQVPK